MAVARFDALKIKTGVAITNAYTTIGTALDFNWRMFRIVNDTDGDLLFSFNGTTDNLYVKSGGFVLYDLSTNAPPVNVSDNYVFAINTQFYVKYVTAATTGSVYIEGSYARGIA
jgi:hypothetical protein